MIAKALAVTHGPLPSESPGSEIIEKMFFFINPIDLLLRASSLLGFRQRAMRNRYAGLFPGVAGRWGLGAPCAS